MYITEGGRDAECRAEGRDRGGATRVGGSGVGGETARGGEDLRGRWKRKMEKEIRNATQFRDALSPRREGSPWNCIIWRQDRAFPFATVCLQ